MKKILSFAVICALGAVLLSSCDRKTSSDSQPKGVTKSDVDSVSYMVGYSTGMQISQSGLGALSTNSIIKGIKDATKGVEVDYAVFQNTINGFMDKRSEALSKENTAASARMLAANGKKSGVVTTESGLQYKIVREGNDVRPGPMDTVEVNYEGTNLKGKVFDSSYDRGQSITFPLNGVIKGWTEGLQLVGEGGEIMLWIPAELAYGDRNVGANIGPNEALTFKVELISVSPCVEPDPAGEE